MLGAWKSLGQAHNGWRKLDELLRTAPSAARTSLPLPEGTVAVDGLVVMNPRGGGPILQGLSFRVAPGEVVAIVGPSGAGKSTLVRTIAGAGGPYNGAIRFDGAEIKDYDPERLAQRIGYSPQESTLFAGTVKDNIARFSTFAGVDPRVVDGQVIDAARACGAHEMILRLQDGYDTVLGWGGRGLSAGQAQRIALARALYGSPTVLILDEPNAHLDSEGEAILVDTIRDQKARGVTVLMVAHRSGVLAAVDRLMVLRDGRVEIFGSRDEVLARLTPPPAKAHSSAAAVHA
jgi:ATP-binding cassette subfamily C protein